MKSILIFASSLFIAVQSASILPIESSSSVQVKSNGQEYAYSIKETQHLPLEPLSIPAIQIIENPLLKIQHEQPIPVIDLKKTDNRELPIAPIQPQEKLTELDNQLTGQEVNQLNDGSKQLTGQKLEGRLEQLHITYPGYRVVPLAEYQLLEYPYYNPYLNNYAYHYPYLRLL